jgi:hypothetical protein
MNAPQIFLLISAVGLTPIALSYGVNPQASLKFLFDISLDKINGTHIFRAIMGLYLALIIFWILGARVEKLTQPALCSLVVFMLGLAGGRTLSLLLDGMPNQLLIVYLVLELIFGAVGIWMLKKWSDLAPKSDPHI